MTQYENYNFKEFLQQLNYQKALFDSDMLTKSLHVSTMNIHTLVKHVNTNLYVSNLWNLATLSGPLIFVCIVAYIRSGPATLPGH